MPVPHEALISWLKYFDVEYLDEECCAKLSLLDPNEPAQFRQAVEIAVLPDFRNLNGISRQSLRKVLQTAVSASDSELAQAFARVEMPFSCSPRSRTAMLKLLWSGVFNEAL
jgi:hypothetical protein